MIYAIIDGVNILFNYYCLLATYGWLTRYDIGNTKLGSLKGENRSSASGLDCARPIKVAGCMAADDHQTLECECIEKTAV